MARAGARRRGWRLAALLLLVLLIGLAASGTAQRGWQAGVLASRLALPQAAPAVERLPAIYEVETRQQRADLYRPSGREPAAGLVLVPGASREGKDEPLLVAFAAALADSGFAVLVPDIESLRQLQVRADDAREIVDAAGWLAEKGPSRQVGVAAISYAVGPAVLAALEPAGRRDIGFILGIGGYYDSAAAIAYFTTGRHPRVDEAADPARPPNPYGLAVFLLSNAERLSDGRDRELLRVMAFRRLRDPTAEIDDLTPRLGREGQAVLALIANRDPRRVPELLTALPSELAGEIAALDLSRRDLGALQAALLLVHGRDDPIIPAVESASLAEAVPELASLYLLDNLRHVRLSAGGLRDAWRLYSAAYRLLALRDGLAEGR